MTVDWDALARQARGVEPCPNPHKRQYLTRGDAKAHIANGTFRQAMWCYRCVCGFWHLTSKRPRENESEFRP